MVTIDRVSERTRLHIGKWMVVFGRTKKTGVHLTDANGIYPFHFFTVFWYKS